MSIISNKVTAKKIIKKMIIIIIMLFIKMIIIIIPFILVINELFNFSYNGGFVSEQVREVYMNELDTSTLKFHCPLDCLSSNLSATISKNFGFSFFSKYCIDGIGTIPRWSKLHERVEVYYAIALKNNL